MPQILQKKATGDLIALIGLNIIPFILLLELIGVVSVFGEKWSWYLITIVCWSFSFPIWARFLSSAPLLEMDDRNVTFYVGFLRKCSIQISRASLVNVLEDTHRSCGEETKILRLTFAHGALQALLDTSNTPYLAISENDVVIEAAFIDGELSTIAAAFNASCQRDKSSLA